MDAKKGIKIFLIDDDQLFLEALKFFLSDESPNFKASIFTFNTGEACMEQMHLEPDLIILDYYLNTSVKHAMDGVEVLKRIKATSPETRVIMLSSQDSIAIASEMLEHGALDYVSKNESAFVRIKNIVSNLSKTDNIIEKINKDASNYKKVTILVVVVIVVLLILSRLYSYFSP
jgi:two-component system OmpR family response regulator